MFFLNSEQRARNAVAEQAIGSLQDGLRSPILRKKIGTSLGSLVAIASRLYVPNIRHSLVHPPKKSKHADGIAVIAVHPTERLFVAEHYAQQSEEQRVNAQQQFIAAGLSELDTRVINHMAKRTYGYAPAHLHLSATHSQRVMGETWTTQLSLPPMDHSEFRPTPRKAVAWSRRGRPIIALSRWSPRIFIPTSLMLHEAEHVKQLEAEPISPIYALDDHVNNRAWMLGKELPAHRVGALGAEALLEAGTASSNLHTIDHTQLAVEDLRRGICSAHDPFDAAGQHTQELFDGMERLGIT